MIDIQGRNVCLICGRRTDEPFCEGEEYSHERVPTWMFPSRDEPRTGRNGSAMKRRSENKTLIVGEE